MQVFLPYADFTESAKVLDTSRLNNQLNESLIIIRSNIGYYPARSNGVVGWEQHPACRLWKGHELQLAKYSIELAKEFLYNRPLPSCKAVQSLESRRNALKKWSNLLSELEARNFPDTYPFLIGQEDFHSAFRAALLYKEMKDLTYKKFRKGEYPDHAIIRALLPNKATWKRQDYKNIWTYFGKPELVWYSQFGWTEEPTDLKVFYTEDRKSVYQDREDRKAAKPTQAWYRKKSKKYI